MSLEKFITDMLNIDLNNIEKLDSISNSKKEVTVKIRLKKIETVCPFCKEKPKNHGYYDRKLTHSTLMNRKCTIVYSQRRYYCKECEYTFHENNPFINTKEGITIETKINVLKDLKYPSSTYTAVARRNNISVTKCMNIFDSHVDIERKVLPEVLSMDEHYFP